jgi:hypothetical protein
LQGLFFGLGQVFTNLQNHEQEVQYEHALVRTTFAMVWCVNFAWAFLVGFIFIPHGSWASSLMPEGLHFVWEPGVMTMDTLFLDPLIILNLLNMFVSMCSAIAPQQFVLWHTPVQT